MLLNWKPPTNGSTGLTKGSSVTTKESPDSSEQQDPLEKARDKLREAGEANNLLLDAADWDEDTARHEVTVNLNNPAPPQQSQPHIEVQQESPGVLNVVFTVVQKFPAWGAVLVALAAIVAWAFLKWSGKL